MTHSHAHTGRFITATGVSKMRGSHPFMCRGAGGEEAVEVEGEEGEEVLVAVDMKDNETLSSDDGDDGMRKLARKDAEAAPR